MTGTSYERPEGYLGTDARISSGPAPELVEAGYGLEIADAPLLHHGLGLADLAHLVALVEAGVLPAERAAPLVGALLDLLGTDAADFPYDPVYGDAYNSREKVLQERLGADAGWMHLGRTRREAGRLAFRLALRGSLLDLHAAVGSLAAALADQERAHAATLWADSTYLQPAQPSTFGHWLGHLGEQAVRHLDRIEAAYRLADEAPAGCGGAGGTRLPLDRGRIAALLGFARFGVHTRDAMWSTDALVDAVTAATQAVLTADQLAEDLEIFASPAFGYVALDASLCRASVLMPQKRNPYALAVLRGGAGTVLGRLSGLLATGRTPSARTDNWLYAYGETAGTLALATRLVRLAAAVVRGLTVDEDRLRELATANFTDAADLAEDLCREHGLDYRTAYRVVGRAVAAALEAGETALTAAGVRDAAAAVTGTPLEVDPATLALAGDAQALVDGRTAPGGAAPQRVREHAAHVRDRAAMAERWVTDRRAAVRSAEARLVETARRLLP